MKLFNDSKNLLISEQVEVAQSFPERLRGLLGRKDLNKDSSLWIHRCPSVHSFFMQFSIDVVFVDKTLRVTRVVENLKPFRMTRILQFQNDSCFEFKSQGLGEKVKKGDQLRVCD